MVGEDDICVSLRFFHMLTQSYCNRLLGGVEDGPKIACDEDFPLWAPAVSDVGCSTCRVGGWCVHCRFWHRCHERCRRCSHIRIRSAAWDTRNLVPHRLLALRTFETDGRECKTGLWGQALLF